MTKQLLRLMRRNRWLSVVWAGGWLVVAGVAGAQSTPVPPDGARQGDVETAAVVDAAGDADAATGIPEAVPLAPDVPVYRVSVIGDTVIEEGLVSGTDPDCLDTDGAVYCNTLGTRVFGPETANVKFADDIALAAVGGCRLDHYVIRVTGDRNQDGVAAGEYKVNVAMYNTCPGAGGTTAITGTIKQFTVPAANAAEIYEISYAPLAVVALPSNLYFGVSFSRSDCGIVVGSPALLGYSADRFDHPSFACASGLGGYPDAAHASFYVEMYVTGTCDDAFAGYKNVNDAGTAYSAGARVYFADDISLDVQQCNMIAYEVNHKGSGYFKAQLHTFLNNDSPGSGGLIPNTPSDCFSSGPNPQICRKEFDAPILLTSSNFWVVFRSGASAVGPIRTCQQADPGRTGDLYMVHRDGAWTAESFTECYSGFAVTIFCDGQPPIGACCDMIFTDENQESVCRDGLPQMNCPFPEVWEEGGVCESVCEGGVNDAEPCTRQADCPGGKCPGPFEHPCGVSACCTPQDTCENLTQNECDAVPPVNALRLWKKGDFCGQGGVHCPFMACLDRSANCAVAHAEPGCWDFWTCCCDVCEIDPWCCRVAWDRECVKTAAELRCGSLWNDRCNGALEIEANGSVVLSNLLAGQPPGNPGFSCHRETPGAQGYHSAWFKFEAIRTSARIQTCYSDYPGDDSLLAVYRVGDPSTPETACATLEEIACSDDRPGCGAGYTSKLCATGLVPGDIYYIQLASRDAEGGGLHQMDIESPCTASPRPNCLPGEVAFLEPPDGLVDARRHAYEHGDWNVRRIDAVLVAAPEGADNTACWSICETAGFWVGPNSITDIVDHGDGTYTIHLDHALPPGRVTAITYTDKNDVATTGKFTSHPANVNADSRAAPSDILYLIDVINGVRTAPWGRYSTDCNHSGATEPSDILCVIDQLRGSDWEAWNGTALPVYEDGCVRRCGRGYENACGERDFCKFPEGECDIHDNVGVCTFMPTVCPDEYDFVCGCDGVTYSNECYADAVGVSIDHRGPCEP